MSYSPGSTREIKIVFAYFSKTKKDKSLRQQLEDHLSGLKAAGVSMNWFEYNEEKIEPTQSLFDDSNPKFNQLIRADVVGLLITPECISLIQNKPLIQRAIQQISQRREQENIFFVPLLLREVHSWNKVLVDLTPLPTNAKAVNIWQNKDEAFTNVAQGIEEIIDEWKKYQQTLQDYRYYLYNEILKEYPLTSNTINKISNTNHDWKFKNHDKQLIEKAIIADYKQKLKRYEQEFLRIIRFSNTVSEQDRERLKTLQNDLNLKDEVVTVIEKDVTEEIAAQPIRRFIGYQNQSSPVGIAAILLVVATLLGFCNSSPETQVTNLESQRQNKRQITSENIDYIKRGNDHHLQKEYQAAIKDYTQAIKISPKNAEVYIKRGNTRHSLKDYQGAIKDYNQAIQIAPNNINAYIKRGHAQYFLKKYQASIDDYTRAIRFSPDSADAYKYRGLVYENNLQNKQEAIKNYQKAATLYAKQGAIDNSKKLLDKIQKLRQSKPRSSN